MASPKILYCHCTYARVVPEDVKQEVLQRLCDSGRPFDAVADLCEMSAKGDPCLHELADQPGLQISACYPRAVKWLFSAAKAPLRDDTQILNMRTQSSEEISSALLEESLPQDEKAQP